MITDMDRHAEWIKAHADRYGEETVEKFLEIALSINGLINPYRDFIVSDKESLEDRLREKEQPPEKPRLIQTGFPFVDKMLNTPEHLEAERRRILTEERKRKKFPRKLQPDILQFLIDNARMNNPNFPPWQRDILNMIKDEAHYFVPQKLTKIMNEGWASFWHVQFMAGMKLAGDEGIFDFSRLHSSVASLIPCPDIKPDALGLALYRWIEHKWDTGKHGRDYEECKNLDQKTYWDTKDMKGREMLFHVRKHYNDILFISEFLDQEFCDEHKLWKYGPDGRGNIVIKSKDAKVVRDEIVKGLYNCGEPLVYVKNANYENKGQLLLYHDFDFNEQTIDLKKSLPVLRNIRQIWGRDVCLQTKLPVEQGNGHTFARSIIRCTEKVFVYKSFDESGEVIKEQEVDIDEFTK